MGFDLRGTARAVGDFVLVPSNALFVLLALGVLLLLMRRWRRLAVACVTLSMAGFGIFGYTSAGELLMAPLVTRFPPGNLATAAEPYGIVVLGAALEEDTAALTGSLVELHDGAETVLNAAFLAERYPNARIIVSGGGPAIPSPEKPAEGMRRLLLLMGIADSRIAVDAKSESTHEHIENTLALIGADRDKVWWIITPAHRMARVIGGYRKAGFEPVAWPVDFRWTPPFDPLYMRPMLEGLAMTDDAVHEWVGLAVYYLTGRIDTIFPAPR